MPTSYYTSTPQLSLSLSPTLSLSSSNRFGDIGTFYVHTVIAAYNTRWHQAKTKTVDFEILITVLSLLLANSNFHLTCTVSRVAFAFSQPGSDLIAISETRWRQTGVEKVNSERVSLVSQ